MKSVRSWAGQGGFCMKKLWAILVSLSLVVSLAAPAFAADTSATASTLRLESVTGTATVKNAAGREQKTTKALRLYSGYEVETAKKSYAYISLDSDKAVKLDASSSSQVFQSGKKLELRLNEGKMYFNVSAPVKSDETLSIRTSTMVTGVRGTAGWFEALNPYTGRVALLEGELDIVSTDPTTNQPRTTTITGGQIATVVYYGHSRSAALEQQAILDLISQGVIRKDNIILDESATGLTVEELQEDGVPGFVAEEVASDSDLQDRIIEAIGLNVDEIIDDATARRAGDEASADLKDKEIQAELDRTNATDVGTGIQNPDPKPIIQTETVIKTETVTETITEALDLDNPSSEDIAGAFEDVDAIAISNANLDLHDLDGEDEAGNALFPDSKTLYVLSGSVSNSEETDLDGTLVIMPDASMSNDSTININTANSLHIGGAFTNEDTGIINVGTADGDGLLEVKDYGTLYNYGTINVATADSRVLSFGRLDNSGAININAANAGLATLGETYNGGEITVSAGQLYNNGELSNTGDIILLSGSGANLFNEGTFVNEGSFPVSAAVVFENHGTYEDYASGAVVSNNGIYRYLGDLDGLADYEDGDEIRLNAGGTLPGDVDCTVTLDLNDQSVDAFSTSYGMPALCVMPGGDLTVIDSSASGSEAGTQFSTRTAGTGEITVPVAVADGGTFRMEGGTISVGDDDTTPAPNGDPLVAALINQGSTTIAGGALDAYSEADFGLCYGAHLVGGSLTVEEGSLISAASGSEDVYTSGIQAEPLSGNLLYLTINGGDIYSDAPFDAIGICARGTELTINGGTINSVSNSSLSNRCCAGLLVDYGSYVVIGGGDINAIDAGTSNRSTLLGVDVIGSDLTIAGGTVSCSASGYSGDRMGTVLYWDYPDDLGHSVSMDLTGGTLRTNCLDTLVNLDGYVHDSWHDAWVDTWYLPIASRPDADGYYFIMLEYAYEELPT